MNWKSAGHPLVRATEFASSVGAQTPVFLAPMAGACPPSLSIAVANAGGMGACGALLMSPEAITSWAEEFRKHSEGPFQMNLWVPDPPPVRDEEAEARQREFLSGWGPNVPADAGNGVLADFEAQCRAMIEARPTAISSIMGLYPPSFIAEIKAHGIRWFATATTVAEARAAEAAEADAIVAQGMEAGGHRGAFRAAEAEAEAEVVGLFALLPQIRDAVSVPVIAAGGIADGRGIAAALILGASAVHIGTGFLRCPEANLNPAYAARLASTEAHHTTPDKGLFRTRGQSRPHTLCRGSRGTRSSSSSAIPCAARPDPADAGRGKRNGRC
jgi:nitronate monooxygenase